MFRPHRAGVAKFALGFRLSLESADGVSGSIRAAGLTRSARIHRPRAKYRCYFPLTCCQTELVRLNLRWFSRLVGLLTSPTPCQRSRPLDSVDMKTALTLSVKLPVKGIKMLGQ